MKKIQSLTYTFKSEVEPIMDSKMIAVSENQHPKLLKEYLGKRVSLETMVILDSILNYSKTWNTKLKDDYVWNDVYKLINDYKCFLKFDVTNFKFTLRELMAC